jgi:acetyl-CoA acetyltransferase
MAYNSVAAGETDTALVFGADVSSKGFLTAKSDNAVQDRDVIRWKMGAMANPILEGQY